MGISRATPRPRFDALRSTMVSTIAPDHGKSSLNITESNPKTIPNLLSTAGYLYRSLPKMHFTSKLVALGLLATRASAAPPHYRQP